MSFLANETPFDDVCVKKSGRFLFVDLVESTEHRIDKKFSSFEGEK